MASRLHWFIFLFIVSFCVYPTVPQGLLELGEDEVCKRTNGVTWRCKKLAHCLHIGDYKRQRPELCGFEELEPVICCPERGGTSAAPERPALPPPPARPPAPAHPPPQALRPHAAPGLPPPLQAAPTELLPSSTAKAPRPPGPGQAVLKCVQYGFQLCPRTEGDLEIQAPRHAFRALIGFSFSGSIVWLCGGTLISRRFVLGSALCAKSYMGEAKWARLGEADEGFRPKVLGVAMVVKHPDFREGARHDNVALYKLEEKVVFSRWIRPACLNTLAALPPSSRLASSGYNFIKVPGQESRFVESEVHLEKEESCRRRLESLNETSPIWMGADAAFCTKMEKRPPSDLPPPTECDDATGSGLTMGSVGGACLQSVFAVSSDSLPRCVAASGVYTRVSPYVAWIESQVWP